MATAASAQESGAPALVGQIGGPVQAVAVSEDYIYAGVGLRLVVLAARTLDEVGATRPFPQFVEDIAVDGTRAYVAAGGAGLRIVDISDPARPVEIGAWDSPGYAEGVAVAGNIVYLADGPLGLRIVHVSNPARPVELGSADVMENVRKVALAGRCAYLAAGGAGMLVVNVADPRRPVETAALDTPGHAYDVAIDADRAYIADGWEGVKVASIADPARPLLVGSAPMNGWAMHLHVSGGRALVAAAGFGMRVLDLANPTEPAEIASWDQPPTAALSVAAGPDTAYLADRNWGVRAIDLAGEGAPRLVAGYATISSSQSVAVSGKYAYAAAGLAGVQIIDISDPSHPVRVAGFMPGGDNVPSLRVRGSYLYVATWAGPGQGLYVVDVSDPLQPRQVSFFQMRPGPMPPMGPDRPAHGEGVPRDLEIDGDIAYIANEWGLILISIADPANPKFVGDIRIGEGSEATTDVAVKGGFAFVTKESYGLAVVDVSRPETPALATFVDQRWIGEGLAVIGNYLVLSNQTPDYTLAVLDIGDPRRPRRVAQYATAGNVFRLTAVGSTLWVADQEAGIHAVDVSAPARPAFLSAVDTPGLAHEIAVADNLLVVADASGGVLLFDRRGAAAPPVAPQARRMPLAQTRLDVPASRPRVETVAPRILPRRPAESCVVTSTADAGPGSLRACLEAAQPGDTITFSTETFPASNPATILLASRLPNMACGGVTVDASEAGVILDGSAAPTNMALLGVNSSDNVVRGLVFVNFPGQAIGISGARNVIGGNRRLGAGPAGQGNLFSGNQNGINLSAAEDNVVSGNLFGMDKEGRPWPANTFSCVYVGLGAKRNRIGGAATGEGNVFGGCMYTVQLNGAGTEFNVVAGNWTGTDITGLRRWRAGGDMLITQGASFNRVGGLGPGEANVLSGGVYGILMDGAATRGNRIVGNRVGTNVDGTLAIPNTVMGVDLEAGVSHTLIHGNLFWDRGVALLGWHDYFNSVTGNRFVRADVFVSLGAGYARLGGAAPEESNTFEDTRTIGGITLGERGGGHDCVVAGNRIGPDSANSGITSGMWVIRGARHNVIEGNRVSGNGREGIQLRGVGVEHNVVTGNRIGVDDSGTRAIPNRLEGIYLMDAPRNFVQGNAVAFNGSHGIRVTGPENLIRRNSIHDNIGKGMRAAGTGAVLSAPVIAAATSTRVAGSACPTCTVEVYSDSADQGAFYEGAVAADARGAFMFEKAGGLRGPKVQAVASSAKGTSEFSTCVQAVAPARLTVPAGGGSGSVDVTAPAGCRWDAAAEESWIRLTTAGARVSFTAAANTDGRARAAGIVIGGQIVAVMQDQK